MRYTNTSNQVQTKITYESDYMAEIQVELTYINTDWSPYLSWAKPQKRDYLRLALRQNDLKIASSLALIYQLTPITVS